MAQCRSGLEHGGGYSTILILLQTKGTEFLFLILSNEKETYIG